MMGNTMRKGFVCGLLMAVLIGLTTSAEAQFFRRRVAPLVQILPPQRQQAQPIQQFQQRQQFLPRQQFQQQQQFQPRQQQQLVQQQTLVRREVPQQVTIQQQVQYVPATSQGPRARNAAGQDLMLVEVDGQGRILRRLMDPQQLAQAIIAQRSAETTVVQQTRQLQPAPQYRTYNVEQTVTVRQPVVRQPVQSNFVRVPQYTAPAPVVVRQPVRYTQPSFTQPSFTQPSFNESFVSQPIYRRPSFNQALYNQTVLGSLSFPQAPQTAASSIPFHLSAPTQNPVQFDIARQAVSALPVLAGPASTEDESADVSQAGTAETVSLIEPATEAPLGQLVDTDTDLVSDSQVVPAAASEEANLDEDSPGSVSILESPTDSLNDSDDFSILEDEDSDPGSLLLNGPEGN